MAPLRGLEGQALRAAHRSNLLLVMMRHPESVDDLALHIQAINARRSRANAHMLVMPDQMLPVCRASARRST
jgi:hypothetical protein